MEYDNINPVVESPVVESIVNPPMSNMPANTLVPLNAEPIPMVSQYWMYSDDGTGTLKVSHLLESNLPGWDTASYHVKAICERSDTTIGTLILALNHAHMQIRELGREKEIFADTMAKDFKIISDALLYQADKRNWCGEYDDVVDEVNEELSGYYKLEIRERDFDIEITSDITVTETITVRARNLDDAIEKAEEEFDLEESVARGNYSQGNYTVEKA